MSRLDELIAEFAPEGVTYGAIGDVAECISGGTPTSGVSEFWENGSIPWMSSGEVSKGTVLGTDKKITQSGFDSCSTKMLPPGAVVMALAGQGKTRGTVARTRIALCTNQSLCAIVTDGTVSSDFLYHYLRTQYQQLRNVSSGEGTRGGLNMQMIRSYRVPIPPLAVQLEIVRILDTFTDLEATLVSELEARRRQFRFYRDRLLSNPAGDVRRVPLGELCGIFDGTHQTPRYTNEGVRFVSVENIGAIASSPKYISSDDFQALYKTKPRRGDVFMTRIGTIGTCAVVENDDPLAYYVTLALMRPKQDRILSEYLKHAIESSTGIAELRKWTLTSAVPIKINLGDIGKLLIPIPSIEEQERIIGLLSDFDSLVNDQSVGLPAEIRTRHQQHVYYRNRILDFEGSSA